ncbi:MAG: type III pantothenate kinase [Gammaproteobacteria bacterium]|nr:type III pantothenate kinase [Gammaproteobacteria bacterium]NNF67692.1 type III pantothenate kinase [Gammaproteobacteria bacterium]
MNLLLDIGNTNIKWAWHDDSLRGFNDLSYEDSEVADIVEAIADNEYETTGIWLASVADDEFTEELAEALADEFDVEAIYVEVEEDAFDIRLAYPKPEHLGVDRWLAMIAARSIVDGPLIVADAGTALSVDGLLDDGTHIGGMICPGMHLMQDAVMEDTAKVAEHAVEAAEHIELFADNTASAVLSGSVFAAVALIEYAADELERISGELPEVFLTGGGASTLAPLMGLEVHVLRELVLRGLALIVEEDDAADEDEDEVEDDEEYEDE